MRFLLLSFAATLASVTFAAPRQPDNASNKLQAYVSSLTMNKNTVKNL